MINYRVIVDACECIHNATNAVNGQYEQNIRVRGPVSTTWYIDQVTNLYNGDASADPPSARFLLLPAHLKTLFCREVYVNATTRDYVLPGILKTANTGPLYWRAPLMTTNFVKVEDVVTIPSKILEYCIVCTSTQQVYAAPYSADGYNVTLSGGGTIIGSYQR